MFAQQFHYGIFYAYLKHREQEVRNLMWLSECIAQGKSPRIDLLGQRHQATRPD